MRREIAHALLNKKNVLPVLLRDFSFPPKEKLPEDIRELPFQNGVGASPEHHHDTLLRLEKRLTAKRVWYRRPFIWVGGLAVAAALAVFTPKIFNAEHPYPSTRKETQQVNEMIALVARQTTAYESATAAQLSLVAKARRSVEVDNPSVYETEVSSFRHSMREARDILEKAKFPEAQLTALRNSPIDVDVLLALPDLVDSEMDDSSRNLPTYLAFLTKHDNMMSKADKLDCIDRKKDEVELNASLYALGIMELFLPVQWEATGNFRKLVPTFVSIPRLSRDWPRDKEALEREQNSVLEKMEASLRGAAVLTGDMNRDLAKEERTFESMLVSAGASKENASELSGKIGIIAAENAELTELKSRLAQKKEEVYRKFRPVANDNPGILWGKMLRFRALKMNDAALESLEILGKKSSPDFPPDAIKAMEALVRLGDEAPFAAGVIVSGYEPPATSHAIFKVGDIIVARDGTSIRTFDDFKAQIGSRYRFWRLDADGAFKRLESVLPAAQPRVGLLEINETDD